MAEQGGELRTPARVLQYIMTTGRPHPGDSLHGVLLAASPARFTSWRVDETYIKIRGKWGYLYRGVDKNGQTIDFFLSEQRDIAAAKRFLQQAIETRGVPQKITLDGYAASYEAVAELQKAEALPPALLVRTSRYLNNLIEQDHRRIKQRVKPMLGFKRFDYAVITITGIELVHQVKKRQFDVSALCSPTTRTPRMWETVLVA